MHSGVTLAPAFFMCFSTFRRSSHTSWTVDQIRSSRLLIKLNTTPRRWKSKRSRHFITSFFRDFFFCCDCFFIVPLLQLNPLFVFFVFKLLHNFRQDFSVSTGANWLLIFECCKFKTWLIPVPSGGSNTFKRSVYLFSIGAREIPEFPFVMVSL